MLKNKLRQLWIKSLFFSPFVYKTKKKVTAILTTCYQKRLLKQKSLIKCFLAIWILFVFCFLLIVNTFHHVHFHSSYQQKIITTSAKRPVPLCQSLGNVLQHLFSLRDLRFTFQSGAQRSFYSRLRWFMITDSYISNCTRPQIS